MVDKKITDLPAGSAAAGGLVEMVQTGASVQITLGTLAYQAAGAVNITGGSITGITDLAIADGGTGASTAAGARTNLGVGTGDSPEFAAVNIGAAADTTVSRASAGDLNVEGNRIFRVGGADVPVADGGTGASTAAGAATNLGLGTGDSPQFTAVNIGAAADTTVSRASAGDIAVEGNLIYRAGGTDVPVADGGSGRSSHTAYAVICGGTTATAAQQSVASVGTSGQVLTSNGAGALPTFQTGGGGGANTALGNLAAVAINTSLLPAADGTISLGSGSFGWNFLFIAASGAIEFANGDVTITHASNQLDFAGATNGYTFATGAVRPASNDGSTLGESGTAWSDLFLASGAVIGFNAGDVNITHSSNTLTITGGGLVLAAGTTTVASLVIPDGTLMTTPTYGAIEFDGNVFTAAPTAGQRGAITASMISRVRQSDVVLANVNTAQNWLPSGNDVFTTGDNSTCYMFDMYLRLTRTAGTTAHTINISFAGSSFAFDGWWVDIAHDAAGTGAGTFVAVTRVYGGTSSNITVTASNSSANEALSLRAGGMIEFNTAGTTFTPQVTYSAAPGGAPSVKVGSYIRLWPVMGNTAAFLGSWG